MSQKICAGVLAVALHLGLFILATRSGGEREGRDSGDVLKTRLVMIEAPAAQSSEGIELPPVEPVVPAPSIEDIDEKVLDAAKASVRWAFRKLDILPEPSQPAVVESVAPAIEAPILHVDPSAVEPATLAISPAERQALSKHLERIAEESIDSTRAKLSWEEDGKQYTAVLIRERANDATDLERVVAEISASDGGREWTTRVNLKRLAFSQFSQMVDRWDPWVQLHQDEIIGRFHSNTRFNLLKDSKATPLFLGKVTTSASGFDAKGSGRSQRSDIFKGGLETRARRIDLPEELQPFDWAPQDERARIHRFDRDARILFFADGGYTWRHGPQSQTQYVNEPTEHPIYFIAGPGVTLHVKGTVAGKVMVYSPERIVIEGEVKYARDPRTHDAPDFLGLVSDKYVQMAHSAVTGPGDLEVQAAIFAARRFIVPDIDNPRTATLTIYGSLSAGTLTASEPRYAMKIEYDERFEEMRPPGFPSTDRHEIESWDGRWTEAPRDSAD